MRGEAGLRAVLLRDRERGPLEAREEPAPLVARAALDGDLLAMVGSTEIGGQRVSALATELGLDSYFAHLGGILDHADRRMREAVAALPDGVYEGADLSDNDCFEKIDTWIRVRLTVAGDEMILDFSESDPQMKGFKNSSLANTYSAAYLALSAFFDPAIPRNEGTYRGCRIIAPEGTIVNALPPAPMTMNTVFVAHGVAPRAVRPFWPRWPVRRPAHGSASRHRARGIASRACIPDRPPPCPPRARASVC